MVSVKKFDFNTNLILSDSENVDSFDVYINDDYYGSDLTEIQINNGDELRIVIVKNDNTLIGNIIFIQELL